MVQALVNNLNTVQEDRFSVTDKNTENMTSNEDFSKVLDTSTRSTKVASKENTDSKNQVTQNQYKQINSLTMCIGMMKDAVKTDLNDIQTVINNAIEDAAAETALNLTLVQEESVCDTNLIETTINTDIIEEDDNAEDTDTITKEEDPTMNKTALNQTPENPIMTLVWHTQVHPQKQNDEIENDETQESQKLELSIKIDNTKTESAFKNLLPEKDETENMSLEETAEDDEVVTKTDGTKLSELITEEIAEELNIESVQAEFGGHEEGSSEFMFYQSPQEQSMKGMLFGDVKYEPVQVVSQTQNTNHVDSSKILEQISKQMDSMYNGSKVNIVLNPETLGKVALQIINSKEGLFAQFTVTNQDVRNILMKGLDSLKEGLLAHGVNIDNVTVKLSDAGDSEYNFDWKDGEGSKGAFKEQNPHKQKQDEKQFEQTMYEFENNGNV